MTEEELRKRLEAGESVVTGVFILSKIGLSCDVPGCDLCNDVFNSIDDAIEAVRIYADGNLDAVFPEWPDEADEIVL